MDLHFVALKAFPDVADSKGLFDKYAAQQLQLSSVVTFVEYSSLKPVTFTFAQLPTVAQVFPYVTKTRFSEKSSLVPRKNYCFHGCKFAW